jgi:hypothetical protein
MNCPTCGKRLKVNITRCPSCGTDILSDSGKRSGSKSEKPISKDCYAVGVFANIAATIPAVIITGFIVFGDGPRASGYGGAWEAYAIAIIMIVSVPVSMFVVSVILLIVFYRMRMDKAGYANIWMAGIAFTIFITVCLIFFR